jgi:hypothetical protein
MTDVTEQDLLAAERRHVFNQAKKIAKWAIHHKRPHTIEECEQYNKRILTLLDRVDVIDRVLNTKEKE